MSSRRQEGHEPVRRGRAVSPLSRVAFTTAAGCYAASCCLGIAAAAGLAGGGRIRWVHHALYIAVLASTTFAIGTALCGRNRRGRRPAALVLLPALLPLAVIPAAGNRMPRHPLIALSAAPFFVAAAARASH